MSAEDKSAQTEEGTRGTEDYVFATLLAASSKEQKGSYVELVKALVVLNPATASLVTLPWGMFSYDRLIELHRLTLLASEGLLRATRNDDPSLRAYARSLQEQGRLDRLYGAIDLRRIERTIVQHDGGREYLNSPQVVRYQTVRDALRPISQFYRW